LAAIPRLGRIVARVRYGLFAEDYIEPLVAPLDSPVVFELGAHRGEDTVRIARWLTPPYRYFAWEPDPRSVPALKEAVQGRAGVTVIEAAIGAEDGAATLYLSARADGGTFNDASSLLKPTAALREAVPWLAFNDEVVVPVRSLDSFCAEHDVTHVDLVWADIQGAERYLVEGARRMLAHTSLLFLEHSPVALYEGEWTFEEMMSTLGPDWKIVTRFPNDVLLYNRRLVGPARGSVVARFVRACWRELG
jgi:FkbM family methyltransferase